MTDFLKVKKFKQRMLRRIWGLVHKYDPLEELRESYEMRIFERTAVVNGGGNPGNHSQMRMYPSKEQLLGGNVLSIPPIILFGFSPFKKIILFLRHTPAS